MDTQSSSKYAFFSSIALVLTVILWSTNSLAKSTMDPTVEQKPKIQLAILLDTSNSMDGLINQTRNQLWQVVNEFSTAKKDGVTPILEVALFEYGNDDNSKHTGFVRKLNEFTGELDKVSEGLFSLTTNGGSEYCGFAIDTAVKNLRWSRNDNDIKVIFIAGNEPFTQGPIHYKEAINLAKSKGISVNTIHAGSYEEGIQGHWKQSALLAGGDYMSIDADQKIVHINAPQDEKIAALNSELNTTYIPYGESGETKAERQYEQDRLNQNISTSLLAKRAKSKSSSFYSNDSWDLVDAIEKEKINDQQLKSMKAEELPKDMQKLDKEERINYVNNKLNQRKKIKEEILKLSKEREQYIADQRKEEANAAPSMSDALTQTIKKQAESKNFTLNN